MNTLKELSTAHCVLLATHLAAGSNIDALRTLSLDRSDAFSPEYLLRILLTFLPETAEPSTYNGFVLEVATRLYLEQHDKATIDCSSVTNLSNAQAIKRMRKLDLLPLAHESCDNQELDAVTLFVIHRAYRIDSQVGLLDMVPALVEPFLDRSEYLRTWFISTVLPLLRLDFEYYPGSGATASLEDFNKLQGYHGVNVLLSKCQATYEANASEVGNVSRDLKSVVGPWMFGSNQRKRRKLDGARRKSVAETLRKDSSPQSADQAPNNPKSFFDWDHVFAWLVRTAPHHFDVVSNTIERWDGPADIDTGGYDGPEDKYLDDGSKASLDVRYAQAAFASVYSAESESRETIEAAHGVLVRLSELLKFEPPPDLATSVEMLPRIDSHAQVLHDSSPSIIQPDTLMNEDHPLTKPKVETFSLLQIFVYSAYLLADVGCPMPLSKVAKFRFHADEDDQITLLSKILRGLVNGQGNDEERWRSVRNKLIWLWNWGMDAAEMHAMNGPGVLGKIGRYTFEKEILTSLLASAQFSLITELYLGDDGRRDHLQNEDIEECVLGKAMEYYDNASNGNVTRGGMKKALDILTAFKPYFPDSPAFLAAESLLAATHDLSFYALTLQHGVPFKPVNIRISEDPISLIAKVLDQNPRSYTKLDDLINIGQNLVSARTLERSGPLLDESAVDLNERKVLASRRVIGMAIEAALAEDDFETAYSFVVNRLNPSIDQLTRQNIPSRPSSSRETTSPYRKKPEDDIAWRAAFHAGRHRSPNSSLASSHVTIAGSPALRRLEQRMELLSQALLLAPQPSLPEVLTAWRRCEEEMTALLAQENAEEEAFNDHADSRAPGAFPTQGAVIQPRREVGRGVSEEAPMGLFDVARGAAAAFSRTAFPLRGPGSGGSAAGSARNSHDLTRTLSAAGSETGSIGGMGSGDDSKVRKRDMVANAVTGGLASGIGWVLGATPVPENQRDQSR